MKYSEYSSYKDSGVEWLGEIPEGWDIKKFKYSAKIQGGKDQKEVLDDNGDYPVYGSGGIFGYANQYLYDGKSVLLGRKGTVDKPLYVYGKFWTVDTMYYTSLENITIPKWFYYSTTTIHFSYYQYGSAVPSMTQEDLHNIYFATPSKKEQQTIANYLDKATAKIDTLIAKQTRLIALLKEKRQAVISTAVTRGLDSTVAMKDSGVEWLGDIPEHWGVNAIRRDLIEHKQGFYTTEPYNDDGVKLLRITDIKSSGHINYDNCPKVVMNTEDKHFLLKNGDFVFARTGGAGSFGCVINLIEDVLFASYLIRFRFNSNFKKDFLRYYFLSMSFINSIESNIHGGVNKNIHAEDIKDSFIPKPSLFEQEVIADYLDDKTQKIDTLINKSTQAIALLKEKRTALISSAVTGKIKVTDNKGALEK